MFEEDEEDEEALEPKIRWITFHLGKEIYGVEVKRVREILLIKSILPVPGAPDYVLGITNIRGSVVTVVDARKRMGLPPVGYTEVSRMIVLESKDSIAAIVVDDVSDIIDMPESAIDSSPTLNSNEDPRYINGVVSTADKLIIMLNVDRFISEEQFDMVSGFQ